MALRLRSFNENLFLCCLLTYGCLLRPHQEIRQLKWGDFNEDRTLISLPGNRNKSGRNRIVPVSPFISQHLKAGERENNIFTGTKTPHNRYYFSTLWSRHKEQSGLIEDKQTLYSFRHTGAIDVFQRNRLSRQVATGDGTQQHDSQPWVFEKPRTPNPHHGRHACIEPWLRSLV